MRCIIVASGPSARGFIPPDGVTVISVNGSIEWLARADYWFTLDPSAVNMARMTSQRKGVQYCAAVPDGYALPGGTAGAVQEDGEPRRPVYQCRRFRGATCTQ